MLDLDNDVEDIVIIKSDHLSKRLRKRAKLKKSSQNAFIAKAFERGIRSEDLKSSSSLYIYLKSITKEDYYSIVYQNYIIIFSKNGNVGTTILNLPKQYWKEMDKFLSRRNNTNGKSRSN